MEKRYLKAEKERETQQQLLEKQLEDREYQLELLSIEIEKVREYQLELLSIEIEKVREYQLKLLSIEIEKVREYQLELLGI